MDPAKGHTVKLTGRDYPPFQPVSKAIQQHMFEVGKPKLPIFVGLGNVKDLLERPITF